MQDHWILAAQKAKNMPNDKNLKWKSNSFSLYKLLFLCFIKQPFDPRLKTLAKSRLCAQLKQQLNQSMKISFKVICPQLQHFQKCSGVYFMLNLWLYSQNMSPYSVLNVYLTVIYSCFIDAFNHIHSLE